MALAFAKLVLKLLRGGSKNVTKIRGMAKKMGMSGENLVKKASIRVGTHLDDVNNAKIGIELRRLTGSTAYRTASKDIGKKMGGKKMPLIEPHGKRLQWVFDPDDSLARIQSMGQEGASPFAKQFPMTQELPKRNSFLYKALKREANPPRGFGNPNRIVDEEWM